MLTPETKRALALQFGLILGEIRWVEANWSSSEVVPVMQARARACVTAAKGRSLLPRLCKSLRRLRSPKEPLTNFSIVS